MKGIDWQQISERYRDEAEATETTAEFVSVIRRMLAELRDLHVWIVTPDGTTVHPYLSRYRANFDHDDLRRTVQAVQQFPPLGFIGRTEDGFGVMVIRQLPPADAPVYSRFLDAVRSMSDAPGWLVDLRQFGRGGTRRRPHRSAVHRSAAAVRPVQSPFRPDDPLLSRHGPTLSSPLRRRRHPLSGHLLDWARLRQ